MYSFIVFFKYVVNPMERKIHFRENWLIFLGIWGEADLILRIWGVKEKYFQGAKEFVEFEYISGRIGLYFWGFGEKLT